MKREYNSGRVCFVFNDAFNFYKRTTNVLSPYRWLDKQTEMKNNWKLFLEKNEIYNKEYFRYMNHMYNEFPDGFDGIIEEVKNKNFAFKCFKEDYIILKYMSLMKK
jgi:hypothetical protein